MLISGQKYNSFSVKIKYKFTWIGEALDPVADVLVKSGVLSSISLAVSPSTQRSKVPLREREREDQLNNSNISLYLPVSICQTYKRPPVQFTNKKSSNNLQCTDSTGDA